MDEFTNAPNGWALHRQLTWLLYGAGLLVALTGCGRPPPPDIRGEMTESISQLGVRPIYPFSESHRIGAVHLVDASVARPRSGLPAWQEPSLLLTEELVASFEQARSNRPVHQFRFPQSNPNLGTDLRPTNTGQAFYRQRPAATTEAAPISSLSLAAMPGFTLASVDQGTFGGFLPGLTASVFGSLGLRHTTYLRVEAEGVEMAELPYDELRLIVATACGGSLKDTQFGGQGAGARGLVLGAFNILDQQHSERAPSPDVTIQPYFALIRRIFYLRGVRFVVEDSRVSSALLQLALQSSLQPGQTATPLPPLPANTNLAPAPVAGAPAASPGSPQATATENAAAITALQAQIEQMRSVLATGSGAQLGASFARAATTGVELVQLFDRPLAFGYQAVFVDARVNRNVSATGENLAGFTPLCKAI